MRYPDGLGPCHFKITQPNQGPLTSVGGGSPGGAAGGDLGGSYPGPSVTKIQGTPVCTTAPTSGEVLTFNGTEWCPATPTVSNVVIVQETDGSPSVSANTINGPNGTVDIAGASATLNYIGSRNRREGLRTVAASGAAVTLDWSAYNSFDITLTAACVISFSNVPASGADAHITVALRQGGTGSYTVTWPASVKWQSATGTNTGSAPTLWTAVGAQDDFELSSSDGGTTVGGSMTQHGSIPSPASSVTDETTLGITPAVGTGTAYARDDHTHGSPSAATIAALFPPVHAHVDNVTFSGDGSSTIFTLPVAPVDAYSIGVYVAGSRSQDWTLSGALLDTLTFGSAPASATDNIVVDIAAVLL